MVLVDQINACLPQTQCKRCTYDGCLPYAHAISKDEAEINQCPPGGDAAIVALAALLKRKPLPLNTAHGQHLPPQVALIDESQCIGCVLCIKACPVDAIVGAPKAMHTVLTADCTGCELCIPPCPMDCITLVPAAQNPAPVDSKQRYEQRQQRLMAAQNVVPMQESQVK